MILIVFLLLAIAVVTTAFSPPNSTVDCSTFSNCPTCSVNPECFWCESVPGSKLPQKFCFSLSSKLDAEKCLNTPSKYVSYRFEDTCPVSHPKTPQFLPDWMGQTLPVIGDLTLLDLSLPGTHDTLTYDLSTTISDGGIDDVDKLAELLHNYTKVVPDGLEDYVRQQAQTHDLDIIQQLDNGMRFLDLRVMFEYTDAENAALAGEEVNPNDLWYSLHMVQSVQTALYYFAQIKDWMVQHPQEVVVMWVSKHGSECATGNNAYPNTPAAIKQQFWMSLIQLFEPMLVDFTVTKLDETPLNEMLARGHRAVFYISDFEEFTGGASNIPLSKYALDGCLIDNHLGPSVDDEPSAYQWEMNNFQQANQIITQNKPQQKLYLMSMATGVPTTQMVIAFLLKFIKNHPTDENRAKEVAKCSDVFHLPGMNWCPETLLDIGQLENYYKQLTLEASIQSQLSGDLSYSFPNAIYLNAIDWEGTIRTGTQVLWGATREPYGSETVDSNPAHQTAAYAYADTLILSNLLRVCPSSSSSSTDSASSSLASGSGRKKVSKTGSTSLTSSCDSLISLVQSRRAKYPLSLWTDEAMGRLENFPSFK